jgi:hypothetical protein
MSRLPYKVTTTRAQNCVEANPQRLVSTDGKRWACGRNVKAESVRGRGYYDAVEVWTLKTRDANGKVIAVAAHRTEEQARQWLGLDAESN